jgi:uncharacterized protein YecE (DUF72 family)
MTVRGRILAGTSGFAYPDWAPRFYPPGLRSGELLGRYAGRLPAVELNNTFYRQPSASAVGAWVAAVPPDFRFAVKAQRGGAFRALRGADPSPTIDWLVPPYRAFGDRLGCVLLRVDRGSARDDEALGRVLRAWPPDVPLALEFQDPSWDVDEVHAQLLAHGVALVATDHDEADEPVLRRTGPFLYLRLRRTTTGPGSIDAWAARLEPFLDDGVDCFVILRHDEDGGSALLAERLVDLLAR